MHEMFFTKIVVQHSTKAQNDRHTKPTRILCKTGKAFNKLRKSYSSRFNAREIGSQHMQTHTHMHTICVRYSTIALARWCVDFFLLFVNYFRLWSLLWLLLELFGFDSVAFMLLDFVCVRINNNCAMCTSCISLDTLNFVSEENCILNLKAEIEIQSQNHLPIDSTSYFTFKLYILYILQMAFTIATL